MIYIKMLFCIMALSSHLLTQAAADEMDEIVEQKSLAFPLFTDFFPIGRTANTDDADLVVWKATNKQPKPKIDIYIVSGHPHFIKSLNKTVTTQKVEQDDELTIKDLVDTTGKEYAAKAFNKHFYAMRMRDIQKAKRTNGSAEWNDEQMEEGLFFSCPERADIAVKLMEKFPANGDQGNFSIEHFETLLKKDEYYGPYVIVQKEKSTKFLQALTATVKTGQDFTTGWHAVEIPQKSIFQQTRELLFD